MKEKRKRAIKIASGFGVSLLLMYLLYRNFNFKEFFTSFNSVNHKWILLFIISFGFMLLIKSYRWMKIANANLTIKNLYSYSMIVSIASLINMLLPLGAGEFFRAQQLKNIKNISFGESLSTIIAEKFLDIIVLFICGIIIGFLFPFSYEIKTSILIIGLIIFLFFTFTFLIGKRTVSSFLNNLSLKNKILQTIHKFIKSIIVGFSNFKQSPYKLRIIISSLGYWLAFAWMVYVKGVMFGLKFPLFTILTNVFLVNVAAFIPAAPGMIGTYHGALYLSLYKIGEFSTKEATGYGLFAHGVNYIILIFFSCLFLVLSILKKLTKNKRSEPVVAFRHQR